MSKRPKQPPQRPQRSDLYWFLKPATDAAVDRALEAPVDKLKRKLTSALEESEWFDSVDFTVLDEAVKQQIREGGWAPEEEQ